MPVFVRAAQQARNDRAVELWNADVAVGAAVDYRNDRGEIIKTNTRTEASVLGGHSAVIWLEGVRGCVALDRVSKREAG